MQSAQPLQAAIESGSLRTLELLLKYRANAVGEAPLVHAAWAAREDMMKLLLRYRASADETAYVCASQSGQR